jgi:hypothetical protein
VFLTLCRCVPVCVSEGSSLYSCRCGDRLILLVCVAVYTLFNVLRFCLQLSAALSV